MNRTEHLLVCLAEECSEVQHAVAKALRFGLGDGYPGAASTNAQDIAREFIDVLAVMEMLEESGAIERLLDPQAIDRKKDRVNEYIEYAARRLAVCRCVAASVEGEVRCTKCMGS